jgi:hypothetical protein
MKKTLPELRFAFMTLIAYALLWFLVGVAEGMLEEVGVVVSGTVSTGSYWTMIVPVLGLFFPFVSIMWVKKWRKGKVEEIKIKFYVWYVFLFLLLQKIVYGLLFANGALKLEGVPGEYVAGVWFGKVLHVLFITLLYFVSIKIYQKVHQKRF